MRRIDLCDLFGVPEGTRYVFCFCPAHGDQGRPNLAVYPDGTFCFACGFRETPDAFLARVAADPTALARARPGGRGRAGPVDLLPLVREAQVNLWEGAYRDRQVYLVERGLSLSYARSWGIGHTGVAFLIPYRDREGQICGAKLRADPVLTKGWRYRNWPGMGTRLFRPNPRGFPRAIVEGELDALVLAQRGVDAVTVSTGAMTLATLELGGRKRTVILTDWDEAGERAAQALLARYPDWIRVPAPAPGIKDVGEWIQGKGDLRALVG